MMERETAAANLASSWPPMVATTVWICPGPRAADSSCLRSSGRSACQKESLLHHEDLTLLKGPFSLESFTEEYQMQQGKALHL